MCKLVELLFGEEEEVQHCAWEVGAWFAGLDMYDGRDGEAHLRYLLCKLWVS